MIDLWKSYVSKYGNEFFPTRNESKNPATVE